MLTRVLVADDESLTRTRLQAQLKAWDFDVTQCADGDQAWEILQQPDAPRLALLDWMMPGIDGIDLCRQVRALDHGQLMYLILLTGRDSKEDVVSGLESGANDYVTKPWVADELKARLQVGMRVLDLQDRLVEAERDRVALQTAGAAAHEISQPLFVIMGNVEMAMEEVDATSGLWKSLQMVRDAGNRIDGIVRQMKTMRQAVTKPYVNGVEIIDFEESSE